MVKEKIPGTTYVRRETRTRTGSRPLTLVHIRTHLGRLHLAQAADHAHINMLAAIVAVAPLLPLSPWRRSLTRCRRVS